MLTDAVLLSWSLRGEVLLALCGIGWLYLRGWMRLWKQIPARFGPGRIAAFSLGLLTIYLALASPLDAFASLSLQAHMAQHLMLTMVAPVLLLLGHPWLPMLRGLPAGFNRAVIAPVLVWTPFQKAMHALSAPWLGWTAFVATTLLWHIPLWYDAALRDPLLHEIEHATFLFTALWFWWPVVQPWPARARWPRWAIIVYLLLADIANTTLGAVLAFSERPLYQTYLETPALFTKTALEDQVGAGMWMWVGGSVVYLVAAGILAFQYLAPKGLVRRARPKPVTYPTLRARQSLPSLKKWGPPVRRTAQWLMLGLAAWVIWDGWTGPQTAPLNAAGVLPWTHWRAFAVLGLLVLGNLFCGVCPFVLVRDGLRKWWKPRLEWPLWLRNKWGAVGLVVLYLWAYEVFALWDRPAATAWLVLGYFVAIAAIDLFFKGASFCKYVCPIGQFHFVHSLLSPTEIRARDVSVCTSCVTKDCIKGNATQRGCELDLFIPAKRGNFDCTLCLDCVKACPHDNVVLAMAVPGRELVQDRNRASIGPLWERMDWLALMAVFVFGAFANAAAMVGPVADWLGGDIWRETGFLMLTMALPSAVLVWFARYNREAAALLPALLPVGFGMWIAHFAFHLLTGWGTVFSVFQRDPVPWQPPDWVVNNLLLMCLFILGMAVIGAWALALATARRVAPSTPAKAAMPWMMISGFLYLAGIWIFLQPMQMRGTLL